MSHPVDVHIGLRLREARTAAGLSQSDIAEHLGISFQQVQKYESGANRISGSRLWGISKALGVEPNYFFEGLDSNTRPLASFSRREMEAARAFARLPSPEVQDSIRRLMLSLVNHPSLKEGVSAAGVN